ncbi:MAG: response regulator transcription factor [Gemmatimonadaceae bacterium]|nr:response regulator transcription factor [Gemmatimonadaceae bacterium]
MTGSPRQSPIRVLIVDDEEFNRLRLRDLLADEADVEIAGEARDGVEAVERIRALMPDLVLLDVRMPGLNGVDVVRAIGADAMPATIFVTAYDQYAVEAFRVAAVDYLVKPFDDERFAQALQRARRALTLDGLETMRAQLLRVLQGTPAPDSAPSPPPPASAPAFLERIPVEISGTVRPVSVNEIDYILASGPYAELVVGGKRLLVREAMQTLEERLDPARFMRIHRSAIVRLACVEGMRRGAGGDGEVLLKGGVRLRVSRTRREALERWLGMAQ